MSRYPYMKHLLLSAAFVTFLTPAMACADTAYVTNENGGVSVIDLSKLKVTKEIDVGGRTPRGVGVTDDGAFVLTANKDTNDMSVIDTKTGTLVRRVPLGPGPEFLRVRGDFAFVTYEPGGKRDEDVSERDYEKEPPAEIAVVDLKTWKVVRSIRSGLETEGIEFSADGKHIVTTNEGDETLSVYDAATGASLKTVQTGAYGKRPRGIKRLPDGSGYAVTFENSSGLVVFNNDFGVVKAIKTKQGPNGVGFDPSGKLMLVAASRAGLLQFYDAKTFAPVREVPLGRRCWHFTYTPDGAHILLACGRTDNVVVIDTTDYSVKNPIPGFKMPWGVVTYPRAAGSLDLP